MTGLQDTGGGEHSGDVGGGTDVHLHGETGGLGSGHECGGYSPGSGPYTQC